MFGWAIAFLVIALIAAVLGFSGVAGIAVDIAWILFVVGLILAIVFFVMGRGRGLIRPVSRRRGPAHRPLGTFEQSNRS